MVNTQVWKLVSSPWKKETQPPARPVYTPRARAGESEESKAWKAAKAATAEA
jgi:nitrogenase molybdenum-iron protein alpha chain